jgi:hypothetical protein
MLNIQERREVPLKLQQRLDKAREILDYQDDWDGEGSPPVDPNAWEFAERFLIDGMSDLAPDKFEDDLLPRISPGPDGSVDVVWMSEHIYLLMNFHEDDSRPVADFYGRVKNTGHEIEGTLDPVSSARWLFAWISES